MKKLMVAVVGMLLLVIAPLAVQAADAEGRSEAVTALSKAQVEQLLASDDGHTDIILSITENSVVFEGDSGCRMTNRTQYYSANGDRLTWLNFRKGNKVKYFMISAGVMRVMIKLP